MAIPILLVCLTSSAPSPIGRLPTFLGITNFRVVPNDAHDMDLTTAFIDGVAHGLTVDDQTGIMISMNSIPKPQSLVQAVRVYAGKNITDDRLTWYDIPFGSAPATKSCTCLIAKTGGPVGNCLVTTHTAKRSRSGNGQNLSITDDGVPQRDEDRECP